jgi:uncharacterized protein with ParB-like and HNH nuclease domain
MPSENVANFSFIDLLKPNIAYEVPFFQRGYTWADDEWKKMFSDIEEQILDGVSSIDEIQESEYFFGPMVVLEKSTADPTLKKFMIIDGQQRITTIYMLIAIIRNELEKYVHDSPNANEYVNELNKLLKNDISSKDDYKLLKVVSCKGDRYPTFKLIFDRNPDSPKLNDDILLYDASSNKIDKFKKFAEKRLQREYNTVPRLWDLSNALLYSLKIVWIPLKEGKDDPQAIFESLNDRGTPLSASELLCNFIFKPIINSGENYEQLHNSKWLKSQKMAEGTDGFEGFLRILFSIGQKKIIGKGRKVYSFYKSLNKNLTLQQAKETIEEIDNVLPEYNIIVNPFKYKHDSQKINEILIKINHTGMFSCYTFTLSILKNLKIGKLTEENAINLLWETFILLVRRKYGFLQTQKYDTLFPNLLNKIIGERNIILAFQDKVKQEGYWVSDQEFTEIIINKELYRERELLFTRLVLQDVDKSLSDFGQLPDYTTLGTIEHILPQTIDDQWKEYLGKDYNDPNLERYIHTIGNLCLLSGPANSSVGQDPFEEKKNKYYDGSALACDVKNRMGPWNINAINARSEFLKDKILQIYKWTI